MVRIILVLVLIFISGCKTNEIPDTSNEYIIPEDIPDIIIPVSYE